MTQGNGVCYDKDRFEALAKNLATNVDAGKAELGRRARQGRAEV